MVLSLLASVAACQSDGLEAYEEIEPALWCGTHEPSENGKLAAELATSKIPQAHHPTASGGTIDVYVHVIRRGAGRDNGDVSAAEIQDQLRVLDTAYADIGWSFQLKSIDTTTSEKWYALAPGSVAETEAKAALHRGTARDLNLYIANPGYGFAGYATFPSQVKAAPFKDGVVLFHGVLPGGSAAPYNLGDQAVHQVGHWLGLYHTYQADCDTLNGDYVDDTPVTSMPAFGCPVGRDSCGDSGDDPVRNYMDSADDACVNGFTAGQRARIDVQFNAHRRF